MHLDLFIYVLYHRTSCVHLNRVVGCTKHECIVEVKGQKHHVMLSAILHIPPFINNKFLEFFNVAPLKVRQSKKLYFSAKLKYSSPQAEVNE